MVDFAKSVQRFDKFVVQWLDVVDFVVDGDDDRQAGDRLCLGCIHHGPGRCDGDGDGIARLLHRFSHMLARVKPQISGKLDSQSGQ